MILPYKFCSCSMNKLISQQLGNIRAQNYRNIHRLPVLYTYEATAKSKHSDISIDIARSPVAARKLHGGRNIVFHYRIANSIVSREQRVLHDISRLFRQVTEISLDQCTIALITVPDNFSPVSLSSHTLPLRA